jgi:hypothetical protein
MLAIDAESIAINLKYVKCEADGNSVGDEEVTAIFEKFGYQL